MKLGSLSVAALLSWGCADNPVTPVAKLKVSNGSFARGPMGVIVRVSGDPAKVAKSHGITPSHVYLHAIKGFAASVSDAARAGLMKDVRVKRVQDDQIASLSQVGSYGLDRIDQRDLPLDLSFISPNHGQGVCGYIIDSGIRSTHTIFGGRVRRGANFTNAPDGDQIGHGTHVAGTFGGARYGVADSACIVDVKVFGTTGETPNSVVLAAMDWVAENAVRPAVVNMSLSSGADPLTDEAVARLTALGITVAVAAGNNSFDACNLSPARAPTALTTGGTDGLDQRASFSNWGPCVDVFAPSVSIPSAYHGDDFSIVGKSGTSMASPHTAGVAALILSANPSWSSAQVDSATFVRSSKGKVVDAQSARFHMLYSGLDDDLSNPPPPPLPDPVLPPSNFRVEVVEFLKGKKALLRASWTDGTSRDGGVLLSWSGGSRVAYDPAETLDFVAYEGTHTFFLKSFIYDAMGRVVYGPPVSYSLQVCERNCTTSRSR